MHTFRLLAVATAIVLAATVSAPAQQAPAAPAAATPASAGAVPLKIGVIDIDQIRRDAAAVKDARAQIAKYHTAIQADIQKEEAALREANQELARQRNVLSPEAFTEERRKFEQRLVDVQRKVQERSQEMDDIQNDVMRRMNEAMAEVVIDIAKEQGFGLILRLDQSVFAGEPLLITQVVLDRLNKKLPSIKVSEPSGAKGGASKAAAKGGKAKDAKKQ